MSCRGTNGNSATTSLAKFISGTDDTLVSQVFHELRREALTQLEDSSKDKASKDEVIEFIQKGIEKAQSDNRIRDSRRESLVQRFRAAENDIKHNNGPDKATFAAWVKLEERLVNLRPSPEALADDTTVVSSPEGIQIALGDVLAARRLANEYKLHKSPEAIKKYNELSERANRIEASYDASDVGYKALLNSPDSNEQSKNYSLWLNRVQIADSNRSKRNLILEAKAISTEKSISELKDARDTALEKIRLLEKSKLAATSPEFIFAKKAYQETYRHYLYGVAHNAKIAHVANHKNLKSPTMWARIVQHNDVFTRDTLWSSAEMMALDLDRASYKMGLISSVEIERRSTQRAEARQSVLDIAGHQEVDPVNKAFADKLRHQRRIAVAR